MPAKAASADLGTLVDQLVKLGLEFAAEALPAILTRAVKEDLGAPALLEQLLKDELERREERRVRTSLRLSGLPTGQTLGTSTSRSSRPCGGRSSMRSRPAPGCGRSRGS